MLLTFLSYASESSNPSKRDKKVICVKAASVVDSKKCREKEKDKVGQRSENKKEE